MSIDKSNINKIKIGKYAGFINQGNNAIAIGSFAGRTNQTANSIIINAIGIDVSSMDISGLFISPIRRQNGITQSLYYNPTTSEIVYGDISSSGSGGGGGGSGTNYWSLSSGNLYNNVGTNIGIGTTTPIYTLDVSGRTIIRDSLYMHNTDISDVSGIYFRDGTYIGHGSSFDIRSNEVIKFNNDKLIINTDGNIGIGRTPSYLMDVSGNLAVRGDAFKPGGGSWSTISDIRMKEQIKSSNNTYLTDIITDFPLYKYKWNNEFLNNYKNEYSDNQFGTIAQELVKLSDKYPELKQSVSIISETVNNKTYNDFHTVNSSQFIYILMGAVKGLINKNNDLCKEIAYIKSNINTLDKK